MASSVHPNSDPPEDPMDNTLKSVHILPTLFGSAAAVVGFAIAIVCERRIVKDAI